jgi:PRTRC genetic system protein A
MKTDIETSNEFIDGLKKAKDKNPVCKVKPRVTAQSKGTAAASYKGVFTNMKEAETAGKVISIIPAKDGRVYEIRNTEMGRFTTPVKGRSLLDCVRAGFIPALPRIPMKIIMQIIEFFRYFTRHGADNEALLNIYWDKKEMRFIVDAPEQIVTKASVESRISDSYMDSRYIHYMDIHSHNTMRAFFSAIDDRDEKATRLYTVIGRLQRCIPEIKTRISNGGEFWPIEPGEVFEYISEPFPDVWKEKVRFRAPHEDKDETLCANDNYGTWDMDGVDAL